MGSISSAGDLKGGSNAWCVTRSMSSSFTSWGAAGQQGTRRRTRKRDGSEQQHISLKPAAASTGERNDGR
ncbi:hypothetical protein KCP78_05020 [Salmonella enterica subsp. enterica]|nr:hypothetical protein KCP78_05020 [Salmonella enterica subsp. enterica]